MSTDYIVWNEAKTEGFATRSKSLAYEVRKGASSNCYDEDGNYSAIGAEFCSRYVDENCTIEEIGR